MAAEAMVGTPVEVHRAAVASEEADVLMEEMVKGASMALVEMEEADSEAHVAAVTAMAVMVTEVVVMVAAGREAAEQAPEEAVATVPVVPEVEDTTAVEAPLVQGMGLEEA